MPKIKHTKNELKAQREALRRFERFLPMLQLKKQQLQGEIQAIDASLATRKEQETRMLGELKSWSQVFSEAWDLAPWLRLADVRVETGNIAGVGIPVLVDTVIVREDYDLFLTPPWVDDGLEALERLIRLRVEQEILEEQRRLIREELRVTSQRVNLFEKVKIPECRENIRVIKIFLGDEQTAAVARAKIAKGRSLSIADVLAAQELAMTG